MKKVYFLIIAIIQVCSIHAQAPEIQWQRTLGGTAHDHIWEAKQTLDGGYILAGATGSSDGDLTGDNSTGSAWVIKTDNLGVTQWQQNYGGSNGGGFANVIETADGGYLFAGNSSSTDGDCVGNHGGKDWWLLKTDNLGEIQWTKMLGGTLDESLYDIKATSDGGYICVGGTDSNDGDVTSNNGWTDYWVVKLSSTGIVQWQKVYGGTLDEYALSVIQTADDNYIVSGYTQSDDGDVLVNHGEFDYWILKLTATGNIMWQKSLGGSGSDFAADIIELSDNSLLVTGDSNSTDGDVTENHGSYDTWVVNLSSAGQILWQKCYGGTNTEYAKAVCEHSDGSILLLSNTTSEDGDVTSSVSSEDTWIVKITSTGLVQWQQTFGGSAEEFTTDMNLTADGGIIIAGLTYSTDGDIEGAHGLSDGWIVKLGPGGPAFPQTPDYVNLQSPISATADAGVPITVYGQVYVAGLTDVDPYISGQAPGIQAWIGLSPLNSNTNPATWSNWSVASINPGHVANNDEYSANISGTAAGTYYYATRYLLNDGSFVYGGIAPDGTGGTWNSENFGSGTFTVTEPTTTLEGLYHVMVERLDGAAGPYNFINEQVNFIALNEYRSTTVANFYPTDGIPGSAGTVGIPGGTPGYTFKKIGDHFAVEDQILFDFYGNPVYQTPEQFNATSYDITTGVMVIEYTVNIANVPHQYRNTYNPTSLTVDDHNSATIIFYPNPVKDVFTIKYIPANATIAIFNILGQNVTPVNIVVGDGSYDLSPLHKGNYILKVTGDGFSQAIKIIKE